ncbi:hypothetical protein FWH13_03105 [Candidatus Saccharibacteria bacterium]|nr:hypothetical protein [Candidatus Saccharibacteria bacterium]
MKKTDERLRLMSEENFAKIMAKAAYIDARLATYLIMFVMGEGFHDDAASDRKNVLENIVGSLTFAEKAELVSKHFSPGGQNRLNIEGFKTTLFRIAELRNMCAHSPYVSSPILRALVNDGVCNEEFYDEFMVEAEKIAPFTLMVFEEENPGLMAALQESNDQKD